MPEARGATAMRRNALALRAALSSGVIAAGHGARTTTWDPPFALIEKKRSVLGGLDVAPGCVIADRYRVKSLLGRGGMGAVWLAHDTVLRRSVALKRVVDRDGVDAPNALREARSAAQVAHPGVVRVHDVLLEEDGAWIIMEALPGKPLSTTHPRAWAPPARRGGVNRVAGAVGVAGAPHGRSGSPRCQTQQCPGLRRRSSRAHRLGLELTSRQVGRSARRCRSREPSVHGTGVPPRRPLRTAFRPVRTRRDSVPGRRGASPFEPGEPLTEDTLRSRTPRRTAHAGRLDTVLGGLLEQDPARRLDVAGARSQLRPVERLMSLASAG